MYKPLKRGVMLLPGTLCLTMYYESTHQWDFNFPGLWQWHTIWRILLVALMLAAYWWKIFDGIYNICRNQPWSSDGSHDDPEEPDDSKTDLFLDKYTPVQKFLIKAGCIIVLTGLYIITLINA
jgi:hypothetical protein